MNWGASLACETQYKLIRRSLRLRCTALFLIFAVISMFFGLPLVRCKSTDMGIMHSVNLRIRLRGCATAESQTKPQVSSILTAQKITYNGLQIHAVSVGLSEGK